MILGCDPNLVGQALRLPQRKATDAVALQSLIS
jgi:hypothetical protein